MIVNTEFVPMRNNGNIGGILYISYVKDDGVIDIIRYDVPITEMFVWKYAKRNGVPDGMFQSWDFYPVCKEGCKFLNDIRIHEIMWALNKNFPNVMKPIYELNTPNTCFMDIEVDVQDDGFPSAKDARNPVNTVSWVDGNNVTVLGRCRLEQHSIDWIQKSIDEHCSTFDDNYKFSYVYYENEVDLLYDLVNVYMAKANCITGWNFFGYDYPYIYNRCEKLNIPLTALSPTGNFFKHKPYLANNKEQCIMLPYHRMMYDYMEVYAKWDTSVEPKVSNKLDWVSSTVLGTKKVEHNLGFKDLWQQKPADYVFYNAIDSVLIREIDNAIHTSNVMFGLSNLTHVPVLTTFSPVNSLQIVQSEYLMDSNRIVPVDSHKNPNDEGYEGAFVFEPIPGVYKNVFATDFMSLYPSIEMQFNISPDTFICRDPDIKNRKFNENEITTTSGAVYRRDIKGFIPGITEYYFKKRREYKKKMLIAESEANELKDIFERRFGSNI